MSTEEQKDLFQQDLKTMIETGSKKPVECPCCFHSHRVRQPSVDGRKALIILEMYKRSKLDWIYVPAFREDYSCLNYAELRYWNMVEMATKADIPKENWGRGRKSGWFRVTPFGEQVIKEGAQFPEKMNVYSNRVFGWSDNLVTLTDCLNQQFDYNEFINREGIGEVLDIDKILNDKE